MFKHLDVCAEFEDVTDEVERRGRSMHGGDRLGLNTLIEMGHGHLAAHTHTYTHKLIINN